MEIKYLNQNEAQLLDEELMAIGKFSIDQLMELAGLSIALCINKVYPPNDKFKKILIACGPGNNGGDGLVSARHLNQYGYEIIVYYPKQNNKQLFQNLTSQLKFNDITIIENLNEIKIEDYQLIVDCIFGFSFKGEVRFPFKEVIELFSTTNLPVIAVDIPSSWSVDSFTQSNEITYQPEMLISLTAPKPCSKGFNGKYHYLAGRFLNSEMIKKYKLEWLPKFKNTDQFLDLLQRTS